jgi:hypothetical protein
MFRGAVLGPVAGICWALTTWFVVQGRPTAYATAVVAVLLSVIAIRR